MNCELKTCNLIKKRLVNQKERVCEGIPVLILTVGLEKRKIYQTPLKTWKGQTSICCTGGACTDY